MTYEGTAESIARGDSRATMALEVLAVAGLVALGAHVRFYLPFTPVPVTLQTLPVLVAPFAVGRLRGTAGVLLYVLLGMAGAPLFTVAGGVGPTLGYLLGFVAAAWLVSRYERPLLGILAAQAAIFLSGAIWLGLWLGCSPLEAAMLGIVPFVPGELAKTAAALKLIPHVRR